MANVSTLNDVEYTDGTTVIKAKNLNNIQDAVIELEEWVNTSGNAASLTYTVIKTF